MKKEPRPAHDRLISGKLRAKAGRHGAAHTSVTVDGDEYAWSYRHGWVVWGKGFKVVSISVSLHPKRTRELILGFTLSVNEGDATPSDARVLSALASGIRSAREAGWDPESRGRAFRHEIGETSPDGRRGLRLHPARGEDEADAHRAGERPHRP